MRKIGFLVSIVLHAGLILWVFNTKIPTANLEVKEKVTDVTLALPSEMLFYNTKKEPPAQQEIIFSEPAAGKIQSPAKSKRPAQQEAKAGGTKGSGTSPVPVIPDFSLGYKRQPLLDHKPDFLLPPGRKKLFVNPFSKGIPEDKPDLGKYLYPNVNIYTGSNLANLLPYGPPGSRGAGGTGSDDFYKGEKGRIDFNVKGFNIRPWARKVVNKIQRFWLLPPGMNLSANTSLSIGVKVVIKKSGTLASAEINRSSLVQELDEAILAALNSSSPFPSLPEEFPGESLVAYLHFNITDND